MNARALFTGLVVASILASVPAFAQDVATAEALFNNGVADMEAGKFGTACPAIGESYRLDPRPGTLFTLAECHAKDGKTASAVARYQDYIELFARLAPDQQAKQHGRERAAAEQKAELARQVPMLTITLAPGSPPGTVVKRDDVVLGGPSLGLPLPVDPGEHVITAMPPNGETATEKITLAKGEKKSIVLAPKAGPGTPSAEGAGNSGSGAGTTSSSSNTQRIAGFAVGGLGVVGLVVGAVTGGLTLSKKSTITANCNLDAQTCKGPVGKNAADSAQTTGLVSTIGFIVGGVGLAGGAVLILTAPKKSDALALTPSVGVGVIEAGRGRATFGATGTF